MCHQALTFVRERFAWLESYRQQLLKIDDDDASFYIGLVDAVMGIWLKNLVSEGEKIRRARLTLRQRCACIYREETQCQKTLLPGEAFWPEARAWRRSSRAWLSELRLLGAGAGSGVGSCDEHRSLAANSCSSKCGFTGYVEDGVLTKMIGDVAHPYCAGNACARGYGYAQIAYSKDRLTDPLKKNAQGKFEAISWDQAYSEISEKINEIIENHGPEALAMVQDPRPSGKYYTTRFMNALGSANDLHARRCVQHVEERRLHPGYRLK